MKSDSVLILGGRSDIGQAIARRFAAAGYLIRLTARQAHTLAADQADIELCHNVQVTLHEFDVLAVDTHQHFVANLPDLPDIVICVVGLLGEQAKDEQDAMQAVRVMRTNYEGPASILARFADHFIQRESGTLIGISSVAGERGRASNYIYGSAKAGFTTFLSGLRQRLDRHNVHVMTVLPGFVETTRMTSGMNLPVRLTAQPAAVAEAIQQAIKKRRQVIYVKPVWRWIMLIIRSCPEALFKKLRL